MNIQKHKTICDATVHWFGQKMCKTLNNPKNLKKLHWSECDYNWLMNCIEIKTEQLNNLLTDKDLIPNRQQLIMQLCVDISNLSMMIADKTDRKLEG